QGKGVAGAVGRWGGGAVGRFPLVLMRLGGASRHKRGRFVGAQPQFRTIDGWPASMLAARRQSRDWCIAMSRPRVSAGVLVVVGYAISSTGDWDNIHTSDSHSHSSRVLWLRRRP